MRSQAPPPQADWALFLDIDGTLIDIAPTPDAVEVPPELRQRLETLQDALGGAVALVSGRSIDAIDALFAPLRLPAAGQHGAEMRLGDDRHRVPRNPHLSAIAARLQDFAATRPGILIEDKSDSLAVHFRQAPQFADEARDFAQRLVALDGEGLELLPSGRSLDIKSGLASKGSAVNWFMERRPFRYKIPAFVGDDRTDEDGFAAVNRRGGYSIHVGGKPHTAAQFWLRSPAEVRCWLAAPVRNDGSAAP